MLTLVALSSPKFKMRRARNYIVVAAIAVSELLPRRPSLSCCRNCMSRVAVDKAQMLLTAKKKTPSALAWLMTHVIADISDVVDAATATGATL